MFRVAGPPKHRARPLSNPWRTGTRRRCIGQWGCDPHLELLKTNVNMPVAW